MTKICAIVTVTCANFDQHLEIPLLDPYEVRRHDKVIANAALMSKVSSLFPKL